jgi:arylsulfatase A-like enzyme
VQNNFGRLVSAMRTAGHWDNGLVIMSSDNVRAPPNNDCTVF